MLWYPFSKSRLNQLSGPWPQKLLQSVFDWYQARLNFLWLYFSSPTHEQFESRMTREASLWGIKREAAIVKYVAMIEAKATSLLQHISVMLALTIFYLAMTEGSVVLRTILALEILGYLWAALACLRCLLQVSSADFMSDEYIIKTFDQTYLLEGRKREIIYRHAMQVLVLLTLVLAVTVFLHSILMIF